MGGNAAAGRAQRDLLPLAGSGTLGEPAPQRYTVVAEVSPMEPPAHHRQVPSCLNVYEGFVTCRLQTP